VQKQFICFCNAKCVRIYCPVWNESLYEKQVQFSLQMTACICFDRC